MSLGADEEGRTGVYAEDFVPGVDTVGTLRKLAGFSRDFETESFDISPDGGHIVISRQEESRNIMMVEGVAGLGRPGF